MCIVLIQPYLLGGVIEIYGAVCCVVGMHNRFVRWPFFTKKLNIIILLK